MRRGKFHKTGGGSLRPSQRRAERAALVSQKRAEHREAIEFWNRYGVDEYDTILAEEHRKRVRES